MHRYSSITASKASSRPNSQPSTIIQPYRTCTPLHSNQSTTKPKDLTPLTNFLLLSTLTFWLVWLLQSNAKLSISIQINHNQPPAEPQPQTPKLTKTQSLYNAPKTDTPLNPKFRKIPDRKPLTPKLSIIFNSKKNTQSHFAPSECTYHLTKHQMHPQNTTYKEPIPPNPNVRNTRKVLSTPNLSTPQNKDYTPTPPPPQATRMSLTIKPKAITYPTKNLNKPSNFRILDPTYSRSNQCNLPTQNLSHNTKPVIAPNTRPPLSHPV